MLSHVFFHSEACITEALNREVLKFSENGVNVLFNYNGEIKVIQCPPHIPLPRRQYYYRPGTWTNNRWYKWASLFFRLCWILAVVVWHEPIERVVCVASDMIAWYAQIFKFFGRVKKTIVVMEDWSLPQKTDDFFARFNSAKMRLNDFLLTHFDTTVVITQKAIFDLRNEYWKGKTLKNTVLHDKTIIHFLEPKRPIPTEMDKRTICFFATMRPHNGIERVFRILPELNRQFGFTLKVISPPTVWYGKYKTMAKEQGVDHLINWVGFVPQEQLESAFHECFCGLNIQELDGNNQRFVVAGRVANFLEFFLVPVVTEYSGLMVDLIKEFKMGVVCAPTDDGIKTALIEAYIRQGEYRLRMQKFLEANAKMRNIRVYMEPTSAAG